MVADPVKSAASLLGLLVFGVCIARAQVTVELGFQQDSVLPHEETLAEIKILNYSGRTLRFPADSKWFDFNVESVDGFIVAKLEDIPPADPLDIPSAARGTRRANLAPAFNIAEPGRYKVSVTVRIPALDLELTSSPVALDVMGGVALWEQTVGVPGKGDAAAVEARRYALLQTNDRKRLALYVRVTDETERRVFRVFPIGSLLSFSRPDAQVDREGRLHVLFQTGARQFSYHLILPDGQIGVRHMYQIAQGRPRLRMVEQGVIRVVGGFRARSSYDIPQEAEPKEPQPAGTDTAPRPVTPEVPPAPVSPPGPPATQTQTPPGN